MLKNLDRDFLFGVKYSDLIKIFYIFKTLRNFVSVCLGRFIRWSLLRKLLNLLFRLKFTLSTVFLWKYCSLPFAHCWWCFSPGFLTLKSLTGAYDKLSVLAIILCNGSELYSLSVRIKMFLCLYRLIIVVVSKVLCLRFNFKTWSCIRRFFWYQLINLL